MILSSSTGCFAWHSNAGVHTRKGSHRGHQVASQIPGIPRSYQNMQQGIENLNTAHFSRVSILPNNVEKIREEMAEVKSELKVTRTAKENLEVDLEAFCLQEKVSVEEVGSLKAEVEALKAEV